MLLNEYHTKIFRNSLPYQLQLESEVWKYGGQ
jgi:hypothetical protein